MRTALLAVVLVTGCGKLSPTTSDRSAQAVPATLGVATERDGRQTVQGRITVISVHMDDALSGLGTGEEGKGKSLQGSRPILCLVGGHPGARFDATCQFDKPAGDWYFKIQQGDEVVIRGTKDSSTINPVDGTEFLILSNCQYVSHTPRR